MRHTPQFRQIYRRLFDLPVLHEVLPAAHQVGVWTLLPQVVLGLLSSFGVPTVPYPDGFVTSVHRVRVNQGQTPLSEHVPASCGSAAHRVREHEHHQQVRHLQQHPRLHASDSTSPVHSSSREAPSHGSGAIHRFV